MSYYFSKILHVPFPEAILKVKAQLRQQGFGVLTEVNVAEVMEKKLDVDFRNYTILGACEPSSAYKALQVEDKIGTMLPCNVIVQQKEQDSVEIAAVDPVASMQSISNPLLKDIAEQVRSKLKTVIDSL